jgi:hypothetical protein
MKTQIRLTEYQESFKNSCNTGWGCGYVLIPLSHPFANVKMLLNDDVYFYPQINGFSEEITFSKVEGNFLVIGFDTAHSWNNPTHDKNFVEQKANELKTFIDNYSIIDAKLEVQKMLSNLLTKFKDYL